MQLPQPLQGTHPGRSGDSCLEYLIDGHRVVPADRGIFMPVSRRMHPAVCNYISVAVYEGKLHSDDAAGSQSLVAKDGRSLVGAGVRAIEHFGRWQVSHDELEARGAPIAAVTGPISRARSERRSVGKGGGR